MADRIIRPSMKQVKAGYTVAILLVAAAVFVHVNYLMPSAQPPWLPPVVALSLLWPMRRHIRRQSRKITITGDKMRYDAGLFSKTTRNIQLSKIQDVRVDQSLGQRMLGVGNISIETSGETSRLTMENIDQPQAVAEDIIASSQQHGSATGSKGRSDN